VHQDCWVVTGAGEDDEEDEEPSVELEDEPSSEYVEPSELEDELSSLLEEEDVEPLDDEPDDVLATVAELASAGSCPEAICT
jgi:hypothetical protein